MSDYHIPVLLEETIEALRVDTGNKYIDATAGGGGHTQAIIDRGGEVLAIDQDEDALQELRSRFDGNQQVTIAYGNFADIRKIAHEHIFGTVHGILFDIGVSSHQIDRSGRGFSFQREEPLDMRMDSRIGETAYEVIHTRTEQELADLLITYGEELKAAQISEAIVQARRIKKIETSKALADIVLSVVPRTGKVHPATKTFQALRIVVNHELSSLKQGLQEGIELLDKNGRFVVISFHSLEDRIVKNMFRRWEQDKLGKIVTKNPMSAQAVELSQNPRSRSAKLRVFEKYE